MKNACDVLVVDDDADIRESLSEFLSDVGFAVRTAYDGVNALRLLKTIRPAAILLDMTMPEMNGEEVLERLAAKPEWASIPVATMTANAPGAWGATTLRKPFDGRDLLRSVYAMIGRREAATG